jgi:hypothetical protein
LPENKSVPQVISELWVLTKEYARQETVEPLKGVGRYVAYGLAGAIVGGFGVVLLLLSLLRGIQDHGGDFFDGNMSWLPYVIVLAVAGILVAIAASRISSKQQR